MKGVKDGGIRGLIFVEGDVEGYRLLATARAGFPDSEISPRRQRRHSHIAWDGRGGAVGRVECESSNASFDAGSFLADQGSSRIELVVRAHGGARRGPQVIAFVLIDRRRHPAGGGDVAVRAPRLQGRKEGRFGTRVAQGVSLRPQLTRELMSRLGS